MDKHNEIEDNRNELISNAEAMKRLLDNKDFTSLFEEIYIKAFAVTNIYNIAGYNEDTRKRYMEKAIARSVFVSFIQDILQDGEEANNSIREEYATSERKEI